MTETNGVGGLGLRPSDLGTYGQGLKRPECVLATAAGDVVVSYWSADGGGVTRIRPGGGQRDIAASGAIGTNGFAITAAGDFLLANLHADGGGAWRLSQTGELTPFLLEIDGRRLPPANFVGVDRKNRVWITVSTWLEPRARAYRPDASDGFIVVVDDRGARIAADGLGYTNEAVVDGSGDWLYVNETFGRRMSRFRIADDGSLGPRETVAEFGPGTYPDGLAFDEAGGVWLTSVISNRVIRIDADGSQQVVLEECDPEQLEVIEQAFQNGALGRAHMDSIETEVMKSVSSIAFGGPDRRTAYLGNLLDDKLYTFRSPVAGLKPSHWDIRL